VSRVDFVNAGSIGYASSKLTVYDPTPFRSSMLKFFEGNAFVPTIDSFIHRAGSQRSDTMKPFGITLVNCIEERIFAHAVWTTQAEKKALGSNAHGRFCSNPSQVFSHEKAGSGIVTLAQMSKGGHRIGELSINADF
jgi:hypothetical protein